MKVVNEAILILVFVAIEVRGQDAYSDENNIRTQQIASNEEPVEATTNHNVYGIQNNPNSQSIISGNVQYHMIDDSNRNSDYYRAIRGRTRKIFHIKNPFQQPEEEKTGNQNMQKVSQDSETRASNQYAAMQYSLPPEEFLQQMRAENQHLQQQQQKSTPSPNFGYTATPQPQYQYFTNLASNYNNDNQQTSLSSQMQSKNSPVHNSNLYNYQHNNAYSFDIDAIQSTPSSVTLYLSTSSPNNQYIGTPSNNYVSTSSPTYLSSPTNLQSHISSTLSNTHSGLPTYNNINRHSSTIESDQFNYGSNSRESDQSIQVNHYDNSANGVQYPTNSQQQYQTEFPPSTQIPISSVYPDTNRDSWPHSAHLSLSNLPHSKEEIQQTPLKIIENNQPASYQNSNPDNTNSDTHRTGNIPSANSLFLNFVQPEYQTYISLKNRGRNMEQQNRQNDVYSHGDYGWKLDEMKPLVKYDVSSAGNYPKQQNNNNQAESNSLSTSYRNVDNGKAYDYDQSFKLNSEKLNAQEFGKAAAKAQENMKKQQDAYLNSHSSYIRYPQNMLTNTELGNSFTRNNDNQKSYIYDHSNAYVNAQTDFMTASPYDFPNSRESQLDNKVKQLFDHDKVLRNIVKIDDSNVTPNTDTQTNIGTDSNNRYNPTNYSKGISDQNSKQFLNPVSELYYKDKNIVYGSNIKSGEALSSSDGSRRLEPNYEKHNNQPQYDSSFNIFPYKGQTDVNVPYHFSGQANSDNIPLQSNIQQQIMQQPQNQGSPDNSNILKLNDIPYWLTQVNLRFPQLQNGIGNGITGTPLILNQNVNSHQIDVATSIINKLIRDKQIEINLKPEYDPQRETLLPTINGLKVVNPYNVDLNLVSEILKGKTTSNDINSLRYQLNQPSPLRLDMTQLKQLMLKNDNAGNFGVLNNGVSSVSGPFLEINNSGRLPYQGVKYSRSQEEEESLEPITDTTHIQSIGAVLEQHELGHEEREESDFDVIGTSNDNYSIEINDDKPKLHSRHTMVSNRLRHPISLIPIHHNSQRKILKKLVEEPYPLLKPPPIHILKGRNTNKVESGNRRQRVNRFKLSRIAKREPLFEEENFSNFLKSTVPTLLRPPTHAAEDKFDILETDR